MTERRPKDIYDRKPTSESRGKTHERIMALQHDPSMIPGAEAVLAEAPEGSIARALIDFHQAEIISRPVTTRRAYERSIAFFARDLAESGTGPHPRESVDALTRDRIASHIDWRLGNGLIDPGELTRSSLHLSRFAEWLVAAGRKTETEFADFRPWMRAQAADKIASAPPAFHVAADAADLRDTSSDEQILQSKPSTDA